MLIEPSPSRQRDCLHLYPRMSSSPELAGDSLSPELKGLPKVRSKQVGLERGGPPSLYVPLLGSEPRTLCIPSPYVDPHHDYPPPDFSQKSLVFYNSLVEYGAVNPSSSSLPLCPPHSPPFFCLPHSDHPPTSTVSLAGPLPSPIYAPIDTNQPPPWTHHKPQRTPATGLLLSQPRLLSGSLEADEGLSSSSSSSSSAGAVQVKSDVHFCAVCHDYASGYHYGVWSCEGCKAFFKRSIQGHTDYICPATNQCTIDKNRRKSCQACRLRRCHEVGMVKCGVRRERCGYRGGRFRRLSQLCEAGGDRSPHCLETTLPFPHPAMTAITTTLATSPDLGPTLTPQQLILCILEAEPPQIFLSERPQMPYTEASMMMSLTNLADKELVLMISWAKKIPGFLELSLSDQVHLLECCWLEVLMLGLMWRSVDHPGKLIFCHDLRLNRDEGCCVEGIVEIFDMLLAATSRFRELNLQKEEYVCLKAMILLNSNMCMSSPESPVQLESRGKVMRLLDSVTDALVWSISQTGLPFKQQSTRLAQLLMLLSHIRHLSNKGMEHLWSMKRKNVVLLYDLLLEMLDANTTHGRRFLTTSAATSAATSTMTSTNNNTHAHSLTSSSAATSTGPLPLPLSQQLQQDNTSAGYAPSGRWPSGVGVMSPASYSSGEGHSIGNH